MRKILIAHGSEELTSVLSEMLCGIFEVTTCTDGISASELLFQLQPYAMILELMLPYKDGLTVLEETSSVRPTVVLGIVRDRSNYILASARSHGIGYVMLDPSDARAIIVRLMDMISCEEIPSKAYAEPQSEVTRLLLRLDLPPNSDGFKQLQVGIPLFLKDPLQRLSKELYPAIAQLCGYNSGLQVEHSIRTAIQSAWATRDTELWSKMFPGCVKAPTNRLFISRIVAALQAGSIIE